MAGTSPAMTGDNPAMTGDNTAARCLPPVTVRCRLVGKDQALCRPSMPHRGSTVGRPSPDHYPQVALRTPLVSGSARPAGAETAQSVMAGPVPAICTTTGVAEMAGTSPAMTGDNQARP